MSDTIVSLQKSTNMNFIQSMMEREQSSRKWIRWWLYLICFMVFLMVMVGGATRLTDSGLSITEWKPIHGIIPPLSDGDWQEEFEKYKQIPEYTKINNGMSMAQFQFIYWWEWSHRFLGRIIGFVFAIPLIFFWATGRIESKIKPRLLFLLFLGGLQGFIGWWMVSSGLVDRVDVSQYRLATHLTFACIILAYGLWVARGLAPHTTTFTPPKIYNKFALGIIIFVFFQIFLGGLVAGLDAGFSFNDWPTMDGAIIPNGLNAMHPFWLNWFENPKSVQFNHRISAYLLFTVIIIQWLMSLGSGLEAPHKRRIAIMALIVVVQLILGIITLVMHVPIFWALAHQAVAIVLLAAAIAHLRGLKGEYPPTTSLEIRA